MKTLFITFFIGLCCFLSACNLHISDDQVEKGKKVVAFNLYPARVYKNIGTSYLEQGQLDQAIVAFKNAVQINPRFVEAHYLLADVYSVKGEGLLSRTFLEKAMALEGSYIIDIRVTEETHTIIIELPQSTVIGSIGPIQLPYPPEFFQGPIKRMDAPHR